MNASVVLLLCSVIGSAVAYYPQGQQVYNTGPNDPYAIAVNPNFLEEPSQRLFWGGQGSNQVGGTGFWAMLTNKFPFLGNMFGRMELPPGYGAPNFQPAQYNAPDQYQRQYNQVPPTYQLPQNYQPQQYYQAPQFQQQNPQFRRFPSGRDVGFTDDAIIVTPPQVPIAPQPAPAPVPQPAPQPSEEGYQYNKPQYRLELPHK